MTEARRQVEINKYAREIEIALKLTSTLKDRPTSIMVGDGQSRMPIETVDCDEVHPNLFICNQYTAQNKSLLKRLRITHVVNCADGKGFGMVQTGAGFYSGMGIQYMGLRLMDFPNSDASQYFESSSDFIKRALITGGRVIVHCQMGISRACTIVLAYLMIKEGFTGPDAMKYVKRKRDVYPNRGFVKQLGELDYSLSRRRVIR